MKRVKDGDTRYYEVDQTLLPSVTSILSIISKPALIAWAARQGSLKKMQAVLTEAANIGTEAHRLIEIHLNNEQEAVDLIENGYDNPPALLAFTNFLEWAKSANFRFVQSEITCYSKKFGYAGTADGLAYVNDKLSVIDWKTSSGVWDEFWLQTEAYSVALEEMGTDKKIKLPGPIEQRVILKLSKKDSSFMAYIEPRSSEDFNCFIYAAKLWFAMQNMKTKYQRHRK